MSIGLRLADTLSRIDAAARAAGRSGERVTLVAVSKGQTAEGVREAYAAGQRRFGENYAQELVAKAAALEDLRDLEWHFIGHLQRNKVRDVIRAARVVQTVDRVELAQELDRRADRPVEVLVEVNVAGEARKSGCASADLGELLQRLATLSKLEVRGLMAVPPAAPDASLTRPWFARLRSLAEEARASGAPLGPELSMGMSHDYEVAIAEGATIVRVGTAIFGERARKD